jgi:serine/threonine protein kinase
MLNQMVENSTENSRFEKTTNYSEILDWQRLHYSSDGYYLEAGEILINKIWVLHISVVKWQLADLLLELVPFLASENVPFKIASNEDIARQILDGTFSYRHLGKLVCIFPENNFRAITLTERLIILTQKFKGPAIPTDKHLGGCVYTNYENHEPIVYDELKAFKVDHSFKFKLPKGVSWPFRHITRPRITRPKRLLQGKYLQVIVIKADVKGCVFKAANFKRVFHPEWCLIKEGKSHMCSDDQDRDIKDRLDWQWFLHSQLFEIVPIPKPIDFFAYNGDAYLVTEFIEGTNLNQRLGDLYHEHEWKDLGLINKFELVDYLLSILDIVQRLHERGYIHRDLSLENFIIDKKGNLILIDLELMYAVHLQRPCPPFKLGTPGFMSPEQLAASVPTIAEDIFGLGALMICFFTGLSPDKLKTDNPDELFADLSNQQLEHSLIELIMVCLSKNAFERPSIKQIHRLLMHFLRGINEEKRDQPLQNILYEKSCS